MTPLHKRDSVNDPANYRPVTVLINLSVYFESAIDDQLYTWVEHFVPDSQYGFLRGCGTDDYGAAVAFTLQDCLERRCEGVLISLDVKGAFDRCWWQRLKNRFEQKGMGGRALKLMKSYLFERFIQVVCNGKASTVRQIFSGVPQGAKWSPSLWDFDISELPTVISISGTLVCYADDSALWYEFKPGVSRDEIIDSINSDLATLLVWGEDNKTTFEPKKTSMMLVSQKHTPFDLTGIVMDGKAVEQMTQMKLVGFIFDSKMRWGQMIDKVARKARARLAALRRLVPVLDAGNLKTMYMMFIRSCIEYGSVLYMGAADTHLQKLDRIQASAERMCGFQLESLESRRDAAAMSLALKLLAGRGRGILNKFTPCLRSVVVSRATRTATARSGIQVVSKITSKSLDVTRRSFTGKLPEIWAKVPQRLIQIGATRGWIKIKKRCVKLLTGKVSHRSEAATRHERRV